MIKYLIKIVAALDKINESEAVKANVRNEARSIADQVDFKFVLSICIWYDILEQFDRVSKQSIEINISGALLMLRDLNEFLDQYKIAGYEKAKGAAKTKTW